MKKIFVLGSVLSLGVLLIANIALAYTYTITVMSPTSGQILIRGTSTKINWTVQSDNVSFSGYGMDIFLDKYQGGCVAGLDCPIRIASSVDTNSAPYTWSVGKDSDGRTIPDGQYMVRVYSADASAPITYNGAGPGTGKPVQGSSGVFTISTPVPPPAPSPAPTPSTTTPTTPTQPAATPPTSTNTSTQTPVMVDNGVKTAEPEVVSSNWFQNNKMILGIIIGLLILSIVIIGLYFAMRKKDASIPPEPPSPPSL